MRNIILELTASLDGFIEGPNREIDWIIFDDEAANYLNSFANEVDTVLYGRVSYELYGSYAGGDNGVEGEQTFFSKVNQMNKYVFSDTLKQVDEPVQLVRRKEMPDVVRQMKKENGKNIWLFGGSDLITSFINQNLIDEYRISIQPVILGAGNPLFRDIQHRVPLKFVKATAGKSGVVQLIYKAVS
ncbi:MAG TPA: dihydrofolate reductase family protein [Chitinophagaceae bacterium]